MYIFRDCVLRGEREREREREGGGGWRLIWSKECRARWGARRRFFVQSDEIFCPVQCSLLCLCIHLNATSNRCSLVSICQMSLSMPQVASWSQNVNKTQGHGFQQCYEFREVPLADNTSTVHTVCLNYVYRKIAASRPVYISMLQVYSDSRDGTGKYRKIAI